MRGHTIGDHGIYFDVSPRPRALSMDPESASLVKGYIPQKNKRSTLSTSLRNRRGLETPPPTPPKGPRSLTKTRQQ